MLNAPTNEINPLDKEKQANLYGIGAILMGVIVIVGLLVLGWNQWRR
jgi:hypothetical protein